MSVMVLLGGGSSTISISALSLARHALRGDLVPIRLLCSLLASSLPCCFDEVKYALLLLLLLRVPFGYRAVVV